MAVVEMAPPKKEAVQPSKETVEKEQAAAAELERTMKAAREGLPVEKPEPPPAQPQERLTPKAEAVEQQTAPPAEEYDAELIKAATELGIPESEARSFGSPNNLVRAMLAIDRARHNGQRVAEPQPAQTQTTTPSQTATPPADDASAFKLELSDEELDPSLVKGIRGLHEHTTKRLAAIEAAVKRSASPAQQAIDTLAAQVGMLQQSLVEMHFNTLVDALDDPDGLFGKGYGLSEQNVANRKRLFEEAMTVAAGHHFRSGKKAAPPLDIKLLRDARNMAFADQVNKNAQAKAAQLARDTAGRFIAPPTDRNEHAGMSPDQRAAAVWEAGKQKLTGGTSLG